MARNIDPFEGQHHSLFYVFIFIVFIFPILFLMTAWERFGCSRFFDEPYQPPTRWAVGVAYWNPDPIGADKPHNDTLLAQLSDDSWRQNPVARLRGWCDDEADIRGPEREDSGGVIVRTLDPKPKQAPKLPQQETIFEFYRTGQESPKFVMVKRYKGKEHVSVVFSIKKGPLENNEWDRERIKSGATTDEQITIMKEVNSLVFNLDGNGGHWQRVEGVAELLKLAE